LTLFLALLQFQIQKSRSTLGTLKATANKIGLKILLAEIFPWLQKAGVACERLLVGDVDKAAPDLGKFMQQPGVTKGIR
jgi:hypothetical protein